MLSFLLGNWKFLGAGLLAAGLIILTLNIAHWYKRAGDADIAEKALSAHIAKQIQDDAARALTESHLSKIENEIIDRFNDIKSGLKNVVKDKPGCDFDASFLKLLNNAKRLSPATREASGTPETASDQP